MKWALIFGASGDIGNQIALDLAENGWSLYLHYFHNKIKMQKLYAQLQAKYPQQDFLLLQYDLTDSQHLTRITENLFTLDALIFAQGTTEYGLFHDLEQQQFNNLSQMQVNTPLRIVQLLEQKLAISRCGRIVFIGSVYGGNGSSMEVAYSTLKGTLSSFVNAYSKEVASLGITVNVVAPGAVDTKMNRTFTKQERDKVNESIPMGRFAKVDEISYWVKVLLDEKAAYMTGQTLYISGGWLK